VVSDPAPRRLSREEIAVLKFAAHRQLARWAKRALQPRQRAQRAALVRAVRLLEDQALADGCDVRPSGDE
jgi:hypothetical protein